MSILSEPFLFIFINKHEQRRSSRKMKTCVQYHSTTRNQARNIHTMNTQPDIHIPAPVLKKTVNSSREPIHIVDIESLKWTTLIPEAHAIVERALYRGFFDIIDRVELERLRKQTEIQWTNRARASKKRALELRAIHMQQTQSK